MNIFRNYFLNFLPVLCFALLVALSGNCSAAVFSGKVVRVVDGDTIQVLRDGIMVKVRLAEIDCPEIGHGKKKPGQPFGKAAKRFVLNRAAGKIVTVDEVSRDRYGRTIGHVQLPDGHSLNELLVKEGLAWVYRRYSSNPLLLSLEERARLNGVGLWSADDPIAPWVWRKRR